MSYQDILTEPELEMLERELDVIQERLTAAKEELGNYRKSQKIHVGSDISSPDGGCVEDVNALEEKLAHFKALQANYGQAVLEPDKVGIGSYVVCYNAEKKVTAKFFVVEERRFSTRMVDDYRIVSTVSPIGQAIVGKKVGETYTFEKPTGEIASGMILEVENVKTNTNEKQKHL